MEDFNRDVVGIERKKNNWWELAAKLNYKLIRENNINKDTGPK